MWSIRLPWNYFQRPWGTFQAFIQGFVRLRAYSGDLALNAHEYSLHTNSIEYISPPDLRVPAIFHSNHHRHEKIRSNFLKHELISILFISHFHRAMAVSISLMFGRLGGVAGSNLTAVLLDASCQNAFFLPGCALIGWYSEHSHALKGSKWQLRQFHSNDRIFIPNPSPINQTEPQSCYSYSEMSFMVHLY